MGVGASRPTTTATEDLGSLSTGSSDLWSAARTCPAARSRSAAKNAFAPSEMVDILWPRWVARIGVTRSTQAWFLTADRQKGGVRSSFGVGEILWKAANALWAEQADAGPSPDDAGQKTGLYSQIFFIFLLKIAENRIEKEYRIGRITREVSFFIYLFDAGPDLDEDRGSLDFS
ncbi:hypothetical protein EMIHUDRAFT_251942 [Emiliania huxleyi CCMP1516]|uniref:Uncharacterized protein n=2 Tax=Emiliania huxleyi TaxID=2903 RepID=A0A0D3KPR7_EMIH1|nr:hypothetical protein EMIHUDRAFT_251942 [Emiliania huxleyi CCMP1516]EOD37752.1 hypothetical protein EMIHUDRAFT_251942 [Emiliania huxleyi CCMP1516]|eukprot:XP_005790181.1 hypothetical protein EMIHUDRAFT_251942 [Emiliania huxleyi CCMP1516]